jgi:threonine/homoserine/homoserine lactone efflux protein
LLNALLEGLGWGLLLSVLTGPIFFTIVQVSIERGFRAGMSLVSGQWLSDYFYIALAFWGAGYMQALEKDLAFKEQLSIWLGTGGSVFLSILGLILFFTKAKNSSGQELSKIKKSVFAFFVQGFFINALTPFPIFFWISLMSAAVGREMDNTSSLMLFSGVMLMVMFTDTLKVYAAKKISSMINAKYIQLIRKIAGLALILSGISMLLRIYFF